MTAQEVIVSALLDMGAFSENYEQAAENIINALVEVGYVVLKVKADDEGLPGPGEENWG